MAHSRVIRSQPAKNDLDLIWDTLAAEASPEIADFVIARLFEAMNRAAENPLLYRKRPEYRGHPRRINVFEYAIFYEPLPEGDGILVWRVIHARRNLVRFVRRP
jgi:plasmid stabilization system protein ParE